MTKFYFKEKVGSYMDKVFGLLNKMMNASITIESYQYLSADELAMIQDSVKLMKDGQDLIDSMLRHYDDLEDELEQAKRDREKMIRMLEQLTANK